MTSTLDAVTARMNNREPPAEEHAAAELATLKCLYLVTRCPGPDLDRQDPMDDALETRLDLVRHYLQRPLPSR